MSEFRFTARFWHQLKTFLVDFRDWASTNKARTKVAQRLDIAMTVGNLVNLRGAVRDANRVAGLAGQDDLFDRGIAITNRLTEMIEGVNDAA